MSFKRVYDALTKGPLLEEAFGRLEDMHDLARSNFEASFDCLFGGEEKVCAREIAAEDKRINEMEIQIRKEVFEYLAISSAPNVNASLILISTVIDYERIGDICKNIAQLGLQFPEELDGDEYMEDINRMKDGILKQFDLVKGAVIDGDFGKAKAAIAIHDEIKDIHNHLVGQINTDPNLTVKQGITYALLGYYIRRINAHLGNIGSTAIRSFPKIGFTKKGEDLD